MSSSNVPANDDNEELCSAFGNLKVIREGLDELDVGDSAGEASDEWTRHSLLGKVVNISTQPVSVLLRQLPKFWGVVGKVKSRDLGDGKFQVSFNSDSDLRSVLSRGLWNFKRWAVLLSRWNGVDEDAVWNRYYAWIQIRGIPLNFLSRKTVFSVAAGFGVVAEVDFDEEQAKSVEYVRARVQFSATDFLKSQRHVRFPDGTRRLVTIKYERLANFCYYCGMLDHEEQDCTLKVEDFGRVSRDRNISPNLRADEFQRGVSRGNQSNERNFNDTKSPPRARSAKTFSAGRSSPANAAVSEVVPVVVPSLVSGPGSGSTGFPSASVSEKEAVPKWDSSPVACSPAHSPTPRLSVSVTSPPKKLRVEDELEPSVGVGAEVVKPKKDSVTARTGDTLDLAEVQDDAWVLGPLLCDEKEKVRIKTKPLRKLSQQKRAQAVVAASYLDESMPSVVLGKRGVDDPCQEDMVVAKRQVSVDGSVVYPKPPPVL